MSNENIVKIIQDASVDAQSLSEFMYKPADFMVERRLAPSIHSLQYYLDYLNTIPSIVNDAINNTAVEGGVLADTFVTATANGVGAVARTQRDKNSDFISVKDFGAIGDAVTDDSSAIQSALDFAESAGGLTVYIPKGIYNIGTTGLISGLAVNIKGEGASASEIRYAGEGVALTLNTALNSPQLPRVDSVAGYFFGIVEGISLVKTGTQEVGTGLFMRQCSRQEISHVTCKGFEKGIDTSGGSWSSTIKNCWLVFNKYGIFVAGRDSEYRLPDDPEYTSMANSGMNGSLITGCEIQANKIGIMCPFYEKLGGSVWAAHGLAIKDNIIEGNRNAGIIYTIHQAGLVVEGNYFELNCRSSTINVETDVLDLTDDVEDYMAVVIQNDPRIHTSQLSPKLINNHFANHPEGTFAFYSDRQLGALYTGNNGYINGVCSRPRHTDYLNSYILLINNSLRRNALIGAGKDNATYISENEQGNRRQYSYADSVAFKKSITVRGRADFTGGATIAAKGIMMPSTSVSPSSDVANRVEDGCFYFAFVITGTGDHGYPSNGGALRGFTLSTNDYKYSWQEFTNPYGVLYRRRATSSSVWGEWLQVSPPKAVSE